MSKQLVVPTTSVRKSAAVKVRRRLAATVSVLLSAFVVFTSASPAGAATAPNGAVWYADEWRCDARINTMARHTTVYPRPGLSSQFVRYRVYVKNLKTPSLSAWGDWGPATVVYADKSNYSTWDWPMPVADGQNFQVYTLIQWWDGYRWGSDVGAWGYYYGNVGYGWSQTSSCRT